MTLCLCFFSDGEDCHSDGRFACRVHLEFVTASRTILLNFETTKPSFFPSAVRHAPELGGRLWPCFQVYRQR